MDTHCAHRPDRHTLCVHVLHNSEVVILINCNLIIGGLATVLQTIGIWRFGSRLPLIQGASFIAMAPMLLIGEDADDFGATKYLILDTVTVLVTVIGYVVFTGLLASLSVLIGMVVGTVVALCMGLTDFSGVADAGWIGISAPLHFGSPQFSLSPILVLTLALIVIMAETTGNSLAIGRMIKAPITQRRLSDTFRGEGFAAVVSGFFNGFPLNAFSQNTGLIAMPKVRSRFVVTVAGVIMVLMGLVPKLGAVIAAIPPSVLGGSAIIMFGMTTAAGIQELARVKYEGTNNALIVAVSLSVGVLPMASPELFGHFSGTARLVLDSGIFLCAICAVVLNLILNRKNTDND